MPGKGQVINLTGQRFGRLVVQHRAFPENPKPKHTYWLCLCDCGKTAICSISNLRHKPSKTSKPTNSCGCLRVEAAQKKRTHGLSRSIEYRCWLAMKTRCYNKKSKDFHRYGGRGIAVCERWLNSFDNFLTDMGPRKSTKYTIERRDNNKGYWPDNCYWATSKQQAYNKRVTKRLPAFGKMMTVLDLHGVAGIPVKNINSRLDNGWNPEDAATKPLKNHCRPRV